MEVRLNTTSLFTSRFSLSRVELEVCSVTHINRYELQRVDIADLMYHYPVEDIVIREYDGLGWHVVPCLCRCFDGLYGLQVYDV
jgi:hypothetical protein